MSRACGVTHPSLVTLDHLALLDDRFGTRDAADVFDYESGWGRPGAVDCLEIERVMTQRGV
jgi:hypothetical protein